MRLFTQKTLILKEVFKKIVFTLYDLKYPRLMKCRIIGWICLLMLFCNSMYAEDNTGNTYPTPERLFHIARSANRNLVCYDINLVQGKVDNRKPINVYWVNREERPGAKNGLNYIQRKLAYGYKVVESGQNIWKCSLTAYPKRQLILTKYQQHYVCLIDINHQKAILESLYVKASPKNPLKVEYVELRGTSLSTHRHITERVRK